MRRTVTSDIGQSGDLVDLVVLSDESEPEHAVVLPAAVRGALPLFFVESTMPLALVDPEGRLLAVNSGLCTLIGRPAVSLTGARFAELVHSDDRLGHVASWGSLFGGVAHSDRVETRLHRPDGTVVPVTMYRHVVIDADNGTAIGLAACHDERQVLDLTERATGVADLAR